MDSFAFIVGVIGGLSGVAALIDAASRRRASRADTMAKYQEIADRAAERALKLDERVIELETKVNEQAALIHNLQCENADLRDWAERLVHQVQALGGSPVEICRPHKDCANESRKNGKRPGD